MHCPYCAEQIEEGCQKCPLCEEQLGERSAVPPTSSPPVIPTPVSEEDPQELVELASANSKATLAVVFGVLSFPGLLCCVVSPILGGVGIFMGMSSNEIFRRYNQPLNDKATAGIFLGTIAIILTIGLKLFNIFW